MKWIQLVDSQSLGRSPMDEESIDRILSNLPKAEVIDMALKISGALGRDRGARYVNVHKWFLDWLLPEHKRLIVGVRPSDDQVVVGFLDPWQQLALLRHAVSVCPESSAIALESQEGRGLYFEACLGVTDLTTGLINPLNDGSIEELLQAAAHVLLRLWLLNPPDLNNAVARLIVFLDDLSSDSVEYSTEAESLRSRFTECIGISFEEALALIAFLGYWSVSPPLDELLALPGPAKIDPESWLTNTTIPTETLGALLFRTSVSIDQLRAHFSKFKENPWFDPLPFRDRPLIRYPDGRVAITMPELLMEKTSFDIFWWITGGPTSGPQLSPWQRDFGKLCEGYVHGILREIAEATGVGFHPKIKWEDGELDGLMPFSKRLAVLEISAGFLPHAKKVSGRWEQLRDGLNQTFVERKSERRAKMEAIGQLARDVAWLKELRASGTNTKALPQSVSVDKIDVVHPVLIAADRTIRTQGIWRHLDQEFRRRLPDGMPWKVAPLAVLGLEDLELIQEAVRRKNNRLNGQLPGFMQVLRWWEFDSDRYPAFWELLRDVLSGEFQSSRLLEVHDRWKQKIKGLFAKPNC